MSNGVDINEVDFQDLKKRGVEGVVFDKDNTLTYPKQNSIALQVQVGLKNCIDVFGKHKIVIFSNSAGEVVMWAKIVAGIDIIGSRDDVDFLQAKEIQKLIGLSILFHGTKVRRANFRRNVVMRCRT